MLKNIISRLFNSSSNTGFIKTDSAKTKETTIDNTPEERLANWLAHPNEYGKKPVFMKVIENGAFELKFMPNHPMKYSLIEYKMAENGPKEIGIVGEGPIWSFLDIINYEKIDIDKLRMAYIGKLTQLIHLLMDDSNKKIDKQEEAKRVEKVMIAQSPTIEGHFNVIDVYRFSPAFTFFLAEFREKEGKAYAPGIVSEVGYEINEFFTQDDPLSSIALYYELCKGLAVIKN